MTQGDLLRDQAIEKVEGSANDEWMGIAKFAVLRFARAEKFLTTDNIWNMMGDSTTHDNRAMGAVMRKAQAEGWIEPTDRTVKSTRAVCHSRPIRVWRSKLI